MILTIVYIICLIFITIIISEYLLHIIKIYELGLQEHEKLKKNKLIKEIKEELKNNNISEEN